MRRGGDPREVTRLLPLLLLPALLAPLAAPGTARGGAVEDHAEQLRATLPADHTVIVEDPFVVIGDEAPERVAARVEGTVRWAAKLLRRDFFDKAPQGPFEVWLMGTAESYQARARAISGDPPDTPYGYFDPDARALVMNIATGGGTLVHEMVHVYVEADFPACPVWLNEGLGSLFEACREERGHIVGLLNWRLPILQDAIRRGPLPTLQELSALDPGAFYGEGQDVHYGMARYLCFFLQEEGKLREYYEAARTRQGEDPTGYDTLVRTLGEEDMAAFQRRWEAWAARLEYDG